MGLFASWEESRAWFGYVIETSQSKWGSWYVIRLDGSGDVKKWAESEAKEWMVRCHFEFGWECEAENDYWSSCISL